MGGYVVTLDEAKVHLDKNRLKVDDDDELLDMVEAVTEVVEHYVGPVVPRTVVERVDGCGGLLALSYKPVALVSIVPWYTVGRTYLPTDCVIDSQTGLIERTNGLPFYGGPFRVTYTAGRDPIPQNIVLGALMIVAHNWETQRGRTLRLPTSPGSDETVDVRGRSYSVPRRALEMLQPQQIGPMVG